MISCSRKKAEEAIIYSYTRHINGFSAILEDEFAVAIKRKHSLLVLLPYFSPKLQCHLLSVMIFSPTITAEHPRVISVFLNQGRKLHTTHSWDFMLLEKYGIIHPDSLWKRAEFGEDIIIANLDTGTVCF